MNCENCKEKTKDGYLLCDRCWDMGIPYSRWRTADTGDGNSDS
jgi:hypothetical protein